MKCIDLINDSIRVLLKAAPENPQARAMVTAKTGIAIPEQIKTYTGIMRFLGKSEPVTALLPMPDLKVHCTKTEKAKCKSSFTGVFTGAGPISVSGAQLLADLRYAKEVRFGWEAYIETTITRLATFGEAIKTTLTDPPDSGAYIKTEIIFRGFDFDKGAISQQLKAMVKAHHPDLFAHFFPFESEPNPADLPQAKVTDNETDNAKK